MTATVGWIFLALSMVGVAYTCASALALGWFFSRKSPPEAACPPVSILKPLHGDEPNLLLCLSGFCTQDYPGQVQIVFGVRDRRDPAVDVVRSLMARHPEVDIQLVVDERVHGANLKISNLVNMEPHARHPILVVADSDVSVPPDYLRRLTAALAPAEVGFATCAFVGVPTGNLWSELAAMAINHHFLPSVAFGLWLKLAKPCFGPTMAFRRTVLQQAGGFIRFADRLADDFEIGRAIRQLGYDFVAPNLIVGHGCPERTARRLLGHELRWAKTIRLVNPCAYAGSFVCHPVIWALGAIAALRASSFSLMALGLVAASRLLVMLQVARLTRCGGSVWLAPVRDLLSAAIYLWAYVGDKVSWRDHRFRLTSQGVLVPDLKTDLVAAGINATGLAPMSVGLRDYLPAPVSMPPKT